MKHWRRISYCLEINCSRKCCRNEAKIMKKGTALTLKLSRIVVQNCAIRLNHKLKTYFLILFLAIYIFKYFFRISKVFDVKYEYLSKFQIRMIVFVLFLYFWNALKIYIFYACILFQCLFKIHHNTL